MAPYYRLLTSKSILKEDAALLTKMEDANKTELEKIEQRLEEAKKTEGETEIGDALKAKATYLTRIGEKVRLAIVPCTLVPSSSYTFR